MIGRYFDGLSPAEIARERNLRPELVRQHTHWALAMLRDRLDRDFGERRAWNMALMGPCREYAATTVPLFLGATAVKKLAIAACATAVLLAVTYRTWMPDTAELPRIESESPAAMAAKVRLRVVGSRLRCSARSPWRVCRSTRASAAM